MDDYRSSLGIEPKAAESGIHLVTKYISVFDTIHGIKSSDEFR